MANRIKGITVEIGGDAFDAVCHAVSPPIVLLLI